MNISSVIVKKNTSLKWNRCTWFFELFKGKNNYLRRMSFLTLSSERYRYNMIMVLCAQDSILSVGYLNMYIRINYKILMNTHMDILRTWRCVKRRFLCDRTLTIILCIRSIIRSWFEICALSPPSLSLSYIQIYLLRYLIASNVCSQKR